MATTQAVNPLNNATPITLKSDLQRIRDEVTQTQPSQYYRFKVTQLSSLNLLFKGSAANAKVRLLNRKGEVLYKAGKDGERGRSLFQALPQGTYVIQVKRQGTDTAYRLRVAANPDKAGESLDTARKLGTLSSTLAEDWVGKSDGADIYQFQIGATSQFTLSPSRLTDAIALQLLTADGAVLQSATADGTTSSPIQTSLTAGTYYVAVTPADTTLGTPYRLSFSATPTSGPSPQPTPAPIPDITLNSIAGGFNQPVHITHAGDGSDRLFVVEQGGRIKIMQNGQVLATPFLDISDLALNQGEQGLLSVAFSPAYASTGRFYVYYTNEDGNNVVARYQVSDNPNVANPLSRAEILTLNHPVEDNHNGGQLAFGPDGYLYIGTGDGGGSGDPNGNAQNPGSLLGKMLRIEVESSSGVPYSIPSTNPFLTATDPADLYQDEIWAVGLRNPWRFSFDRLTGDLYIADVGQGAYEEVNLQLAQSGGGENYGWNIMEGAHRFKGTGDLTGLVLPVTEYTHDLGESVTGGFVYRGIEEPTLQGVYLFGDFISGNIWGLRQNNGLWETRLVLDSPYNLSTFGEDESGNVYVADYGDGGLYKITVP